MEKEWIERYVKIYKHFELYQSFPFDNESDIEWLIGEMKKREEGKLSKEKEDLFEYLDGFDYQVYSIVTKRRREVDDGKLSFEFQIHQKTNKNNAFDNEDEDDEKNCIITSNKRVLFEWEIDEKYPFRDRDGEIYLKVKIKRPWIEYINYWSTTLYFLYYDNIRYLDDETIKNMKNDGCFDKTKMETAMMYNLFEYKTLMNLEKIVLFGDKRPRGEHRIYTHIYVPIYKKKNDKEYGIENEDKEKRKRADALYEKMKKKRDMNLFLKDYFFDDL